MKSPCHVCGRPTARRQIRLGTPRVGTAITAQVLSGLGACAPTCTGCEKGFAPLPPGAE